VRPPSLCSERGWEALIAAALLGLLGVLPWFLAVSRPLPTLFWALPMLSSAATGALVTRRVVLVARRRSAEWTGVDSRMLSVAGWLYWVTILAMFTWDLIRTKR
jgi:hypothetical protein